MRMPFLIRDVGAGGLSADEGQNGQKEASRLSLRPERSTAEREGRSEPGHAAELQHSFCARSGAAHGPQWRRHALNADFEGAARAGHRITFVARNGADREIYAPALTRLGIQVWAHDAERLRALGIFGPEAWTFEDLLGQNAFDLAILSMWFWADISIPEQYLEDIRRISPQTRIAVLTDDQHGEREMQMAKLTGLLPMRSAREMRTAAGDRCKLFSSPERRGRRTSTEGQRMMIASSACSRTNWNTRAAIRRRTQGAWRESCCRTFFPMTLANRHPFRKMAEHSPTMLRTSSCPYSPTGR
jgi:hypothetical protein